MIIEKVDVLDRVVVAYPSGNTTAIVFDQISGTDRKKLNAQIMGSWKRQAPYESEIEQCCYITSPISRASIARVEMFGGEFCGNATRSVVQLLTNGRDCKGVIEVSGVDRPLNFSVYEESVTVEMPLPRSGGLIEKVPEGILVQFDGISQLVIIDIERQKKRKPCEVLRRMLVQNKYNLANQSAVGIVYYDLKSGKAKFSVWVKDVDTIFDETACGSGTCAIGIALALRNQQSQDLEVIQPSGESIGVVTVFDNEKRMITESSINGKVSVLYDGALELS